MALKEGEPERKAGVEQGLERADGEGLQADQVGGGGNKRPD